MFIEYYNILTHGNDAQSYLYASFLLLLVGSYVYFFKKNKQRSLLNKLTPYLSIIGIIGFTTFYFVRSNEYWNAKKAIVNKEHLVITGKVENVIPMESGVRNFESFVINGNTIYYSDYSKGIGFNQTSKMGGPLLEGSEIRLFLYNNKIIGLWVKE